MHQEEKSPPRQGKYVNTQIRPTKCQFGNFELRNCYWLGRLAFQAEVVSALEAAVCLGQVDVHLSVCDSSVTADSLWCHFGNEDILPCGFHEA